MKRIRVILAVVAMAALALGLFAGCSCSTSSGGSSKTDFGWYKATVPEGFTDANESGNAGQKFTKKDGSKELIIKAYSTSSYDNAAADKASSLGREGYTDKGQMKIGNYTWEAVGFTWNDNTPSLKLFADGSDGKVIELDFFMMDENNADVKAFAESFEYVGEKASK